MTRNLKITKLEFLLGRDISVDQSPELLQSNRGTLHKSPSGHYYIQGYFSIPDSDGSNRKKLMTLIVREGIQIRYSSPVFYTGKEGFRINTRIIVT